MDELVYMTEEEFYRFRQAILVLVWLAVPVWIFTGLACLSVLALRGVI